MSIPQQYVVPDLNAALVERLYPTVTVWNRLEGRPRAEDFDRALKAEIRDALWMLTKQWQIGEFFADDAASPIFAKVRMRTSQVTKYQAAGGPTESLDTAIPMETKVERRIMKWVWNGQKMRFDLRAQLGRQWAKLLKAVALGAYQPKYLAQYPIQLPAHDRTGDYVYAHRRGWQEYAALAGRSIDGGDLYVYLSDPAHHASDGIALANPADEGKLDALGAEFQKWVNDQYSQPAQEAAWKPEYLEYQFSCSAPQAGNPVVLAADEYAQGHVDWYSFDRASAAGGLGGPPDPATAEQVDISSFIPTPVTFQGMPDPRWWALDDRKTDFGNVTPATTDLAQLLLMEFGLVYANDWFLAPFRIPIGTLALVEGLAVTNNFGERFWVIAAGTGAQDNWHRWAMFEIASETADTKADTSLLIPPSTANILDGDELEEVEWARDEVANMVWAIERTIPSVDGPGRSGKDEGQETLRYQQQLIGPVAGPPDYAASIAYLAMTSVPEYWIPFMPTHVTGSAREIQLQRSRMLRIIQGDPNPPVKVPPRTTLVRQGLDINPPQSYFVHEEEIPEQGSLSANHSAARVGRKAKLTYGWLCKSGPGVVSDRAVWRSTRL